MSAVSTKNNELGKILEEHFQTWKGQSEQQMPNRFRDISPRYRPSSTDCAERQNSPVLVRTSANRERERGHPFVATKSNQIGEYEAKGRNGPSFLATQLGGVDNDLSTALPAPYVALQQQGQHTLVLSTCTPFATSANASSKRKVSEYTSKIAEWLAIQATCGEASSDRHTPAKTLQDAA
jgi:hypothetical protein